MNKLLKTITLLIFLTIVTSQGVVDIDNNQFLPMMNFEEFSSEEFQITVGETGENEENTELSFIIVSPFDFQTIDFEFSFEDSDGLTGDVEKGEPVVAEEAVRRGNEELVLNENNEGEGIEGEVIQGAFVIDWNPSILIDPGKEDHVIEIISFPGENGEIIYAEEEESIKAENIVHLMLNNPEEINEEEFFH